MNMSVPQAETKTSSNINLDVNAQNSKENTNEIPDIKQLTKIEHFVKGLQSDKIDRIKLIENKLNNSEVYPANYRFLHYSDQHELNINLNHDKTRSNELQKCACCILPKLNELNTCGGLRNSCLTCKRPGCREIGEGSPCQCQFPKRINFSNGPLDKHNGSIPTASSSQPQISNQQIPNQSNVMPSKNPDAEKTSIIFNGEIINLLLNSLDTVGIALKLTNASLHNSDTRYNELNKLGLEVKRLIKNLIELQSSTKTANNIPTPNDFNVTYNPNQIPICNLRPESLNHNYCTCNLSMRPINSQTNIPCTSFGYCQHPLSSAPDNLVYNNCDNRLQCMPAKPVNCTFQPHQYQPIQWTTICPLFYSSAYV